MVPALPGGPAVLQREATEKRLNCRYHPRWRFGAVL